MGTWAVHTSQLVLTYFLLIYYGPGVTAAMYVHI